MPSLFKNKIMYTTWQAIANGNTEGAMSLLEKYGYANAVENEEDIATALAHLVSSTQSDEILDEIRRLHPDYDLLNSGYPRKKKKKEQFSECAGGCSCGGKKPMPLNAEGPQNNSTQSLLSQQQTMMFGMLGIITIASLALVAFSKKQ